MILSLLYNLQWRTKDKLGHNYWDDTMLDPLHLYHCMHQIPVWTLLWFRVFSSDRKNTGDSINLGVIYQNDARARTWNLLYLPEKCILTELRSSKSTESTASTAGVIRIAYEYTTCNRRPVHSLLQSTDSSVAAYTWLPAWSKLLQIS